METIPWYQSAIVRQQIVAAIVALGGLAGINFGDLDVDKVVTNLFLGFAALVAIYTTITRIFKPAPNLTATAARKEVELVQDGKIPPSPTGPASQRGRVSVPMLMAALLGAVATLAVVGVPGCVGTGAAYKAAKGDVAATAYVVTEHYAALVREAANLAQSPSTPLEAKEAMKRADASVKPLIVGTSTAPGVRQLAERYSAVRNAQNEAELQTAVNRAIIELARLIEAVKTARRTS